jgi:hypothetical protein
LTPASETNLTIPEEVQEANSGFKVSKFPFPSSIRNWALKYLPQRVGSPLAQVFTSL